MPVSITANLSSQYAQSAIKSRSDKVATDTLQISSGTRVFSAIQDSAALAVGAGLKIDNAGLASAKINAGAGISTLQIADGALSTASDILVRMQALAVEASSGNLTDAARQPVDMEFQALKTELGRLAGATQFNGVSLLNGQPSYTLTGASNYAGNGINAVSFNVNGVTGNPTVRYSYDAATEKMTLTRTDGATTSSQTLDLTAVMDSVAGKGNNLINGQTLDLNFNTIGMTLTLGTNFNRTTSILPTAVAAPGAGGSMGTATAFVPATANLDGDAVDGLNTLAGGYNTGTGALTLPVVTGVGSVTLGALPGVSYAVNGGSVGASGAASANLTGANTTVDIYVDGASGPEKVGTVNITGATAGTGAGAGTLVVSAGKGLIAGDLQPGSADTVLNYKIGTGVEKGQDLLKISLPAINLATLGLTSTDVTTQGNSDSAITLLKAAINVVSGARATVGAQESRLTSVSASLAVFSENNETARSALIDVDVPATITDLANNQATLQAGIAMLAQSNRIPDMLLSMLRGNG